MSLLWHTVSKNFFQVHIYHIDIAIIYILLALSERIMRSSFWSETKTILRKLFLEDWREFLCNCLLNNSVNNCRNS